MSGHLTWEDLMRHLMAGGEAVAYFAEEDAWKLEWVEFARRNLGPHVTRMLLWDPLFDVERPGADMTGRVTVSALGRAWWEGAGMVELRRMGIEVGRCDVRLLQHRRSQLRRRGGPRAVVVGRLSPFQGSMDGGGGETQGSRPGLSAAAPLGLEVG